MVKCGFAPKGTYGHECGKPAVIVAVFDGGEASPVPGVKREFFAGRCAHCITLEGGDNAGILRTEPIAKQGNWYPASRWPLSPEWRFHPLDKERFPIAPLRLESFNDYRSKMANA
jgi:hypothetical protein